MPFVNVIWQGDANSLCLRSFALCQSPPFLLNITGTEALSVREIALDFGRHFGIEPMFGFWCRGYQLSAQRCHEGALSLRTLAVGPEEMIAWIAESGGAMLKISTRV